ncbi:MAG: hypothetical protein R2851_05415 [Caldilineaceae bacterium]
MHLRAGDFGPPRAHIRHAHAPQPPIATGTRLARWWWAVSGGLILLLLVGLVAFRPPNWPWWLAGIIILFGGVDAASRGRLNMFLLRLAIVLALITSVILLYRFWVVALVLGLTALVVMMIRDNLREVFGH